MKKILIVMLLCAVLLAGGCQRQGSARENYQEDAGDNAVENSGEQSENPDEIPLSDDEQEESEPTEEMSDEEYGAAYIESISLQRMEDFASPADISSDAYVSFFMTANYDGENKLPIPEGYRSDVSGQFLLPASDLEGYVTRFFDVTPDTLRTAQAYDSERELYISVESFGLSSTSDVVITSAEQNGNSLDIIFDVYITMSIGEGDPVRIGPTTTRNAKFSVNSAQDFKVLSLTTLFQADMDQLMKDAGLA